MVSNLSISRSFFAKKCGSEFCSIEYFYVGKVSFIWGNLIFREPVKSQLYAYAAVWLIMSGLYGMSYFSTAESLAAESATPSPVGSENEEEEGLMTNTKNGDTFENDSSIQAPLEICEKTPGQKGKYISICGRTFQRRNLGLCSALICGLWGGSCLVPMHYSPGNTNGLGYVISFSVGALGKKAYEYHGLVLCRS